MNNNLDFSNKKFFMLLIIVCFLFLVIVINALRYLPESTDNSDIIRRASNVNKPVQTNNDSLSENSISKESQNNSEKAVNNEAQNNEKKLIVTSQKSGEEIELIEIDAPKGTGIEESTSSAAPISQQSQEEQAYTILKTASEYRASKQYIKALDEFQKVVELTSDKNITASGYDGIASLYAINKRYGTALSYAIKAYNTYPTSNRELVLARLYFKTGDIDKATQRVNNILRREFSDDRW